MSDDDGFRTIRDGAIVRLTLDRPEGGNRLTLAMVEALGKAIAEAGADSAVKAIAVAGAGADFCKGRDPAGAPEARPTTALEMRGALIAPILGLYRAVRAAEVPVVAAVQGAAHGLGCALAAVCDATIAASSARFALPEMRANLPPTLAMLAHLDRVPAKALLWMVLSGAEIDAARALACGLVSEVVPAAGLDEAVESFLARLAAAERPALATCKAYLQTARSLDYGAADALAANMLSVVLSSRGGGS